MIKKSLIISVILSLILFMNIGLVRSDPKTDELIAELEAKAKTINSYRADSKMEMEMMGQKMIYTGTLAFKKPNKSRMGMDTKMGAINTKQIMISNGKTVWTYQPHMKIAHKMDLERIITETGDDNRQKNGDPSDPFQNLDRDSIVYLRTEKIDRKDVHIFRGYPRKATGTENMPFMPGKIEIGLDADSGMLSKMVMFNKEGKEMMSQTYSNIRLNVVISDSEFEFTPPEGVQVMDITEGTINMMKQMQKSGQE